MRKYPWRVGSGGKIRISGLLGCILLIGLAFVAIQCSGSSSGSSGGSFDVLRFSATKQSEKVHLNDSIEIEFSEPVDPLTMYSGIHIYPSASAGSNRAAGELRVDGNKVIFTPRLPTDPNFSNGGFTPDTEYTICVPRPGDSCSVFIQNSPGVRSKGGRGVSNTRIESFQTVAISGSEPPFSTEKAPKRPEIFNVTVSDANGVVQQLNPITNLVSGQAFQAGILSTINTQTKTTIQGTQREVDVFKYVVTPLTRTETAACTLISKDPVTVVMANVNLNLNEFKNTGSILTVRDDSTPPKEATWAIDSNTSNQIVTIKDSGPDWDKVGFQTDALTATVSQGITRQVAPGDINTATEVKITFNEVLFPLSVDLINFAMYRVTDTPSGLQYAVVPPASTLQGSHRQGITHDVIDNRSVVTLRAKSSFPQSKPNEPATIVVIMNTGQDDNSASPAVKNDGLRDLNEYPLAYPVRTGWVVDQNNTITGYIEPYAYTNVKAPPENIQVAWAFQTRADAEVLNAIVESFTDTTGKLKDGTCLTTAAWTKAGQAGLYATYGYGGSGELGDQSITAAVTLDSDTKTPGPDGVVSFDYNRLTLSPSGTITLKGRYPIRINALDTMTIDGTIDASGVNGAVGTPGLASAVGRITGGRGGPGGGAGGDSNVSPQSAIGALPMELRGGPGYPKAQKCTDVNKSDNRLITMVEPNCGGGTGGNRGRPSGTVLRNGCSGNGGGHKESGKQTDYLCSNIGAFGRDFGVAWIVATGGQGVTIPTGGSGGGAGGNAATTQGNPSPANDIVAGSGGGAGGGIELQCAGTLTINSSATILALGGNGGAGHSTLASATTVVAGYGAGGAGGSVWISGTSVSVASGCTIDATGGLGNPAITNPTRTGNGGDGYVIIRDRGQSPDVQSQSITPPNIQERRLFDPADNGKSVAYSGWYDSGETSPYWTFNASDPHTGLTVPGSDLSWLNGPVLGQTVRISFQGAPDDGGSPNTNPATWYPANTSQAPCLNWETNISQLRSQNNLRHIRFRVEFDIGKRDKNATPPNQVAISRIVINFVKPK